MRLLLGALLVAGGASCTVATSGNSSSDQALPYPDGCAAYGLSARRCAYIVAWARTQAGLSAEAPAAIGLLGDPGCGGDPHVLCMRSTQFVVRVRLSPSSGHAIDESVFCGVGGQWTLLCTEDPQIRVASPTMGGYRDIPCTGEGPVGCATALPTIEPAAAAGARPLQVASLDIPIDHVGAYSVPVGTAVLPNGILTEATFTLADDSPKDLLVAADGGVFLAVTSRDGGPPFDNYYARGWRPGVEEVAATLTFTIESFEPGAVLRVRDVVVR